MSCIFQSISRKFIIFFSLNNHLLFGNISPFIFFFLIWVKKREIQSSEDLSQLDSHWLNFCYLCIMLRNYMLDIDL